MPTRPFHPGFRLSPLDVLILLVGTAASVYTAAIVDRWLGLAIAFVVGHFFLFCNILRLSRPLELLWAAVFVSLAGATIALNLLSWPLVFALASGVTAIVGVIETRRPSYHGVGWQKLNPRLPEWWRSAADRHG